MKTNKEMIVVVAALTACVAAGLSAAVTVQVLSRSHSIANQANDSGVPRVDDAEDVVIVAAAQGHAHHPGQEDSIDPQPEFCPIKSLTANEIRAYQEGTGDGMAKAAERNHYPGPRHALELAQQLQLTDEQTQQLRGIEDVMRVAAISAGNRLIEIERKLNVLFSEKRIDSSQLAVLVEESASLQGRLRLIHVDAHLRTQKILSATQIDKYDELRGYKNAKNACTGIGSQNVRAELNNSGRR